MTSQSERYRTQPLRNRALRWLATVIVYASYRTVEVKRPEADYSDRPAIVVANHFAGFADPVLFFYGVARRPRFLAKATLWSNPAISRILDFAGAIPVHRAADGSTAGNVDAFAACHEALRNREVIAMFPEGTTHDEAAMEPLRSGAARIALGARASGAKDIIIVPVGLHYEDKAGLRSRVYAEVGEVIELDEAIPRFVDQGKPENDQNREAVRRLTAEIDRCLRAVSPDYRSMAEWDALGAAAEVVLRAEEYDPSAPISYGKREALADRLAAAPPAHKQAVVRSTTAYRDGLVRRGLRDEAVAAHARVSGAPPDHAVRGFLGALGLAPAAVAGLVVNAVPMAVLALVRRIDVAPVTMATVRTLVAPVAYVTTWAVWARILHRRMRRLGRTTGWVAGIIGGWATILAAERFVLMMRALTAWHRAQNTPDLEVVVALRSDVLDATEHAIDAPAEPE